MAANRDSVLIIDDEPHICRAVQSALSPDFPEVFRAATGQEGIDLAAARQPSFIVLDLGLPDMPGSTVCREIRGWSSVPILVLSARHSEQQKVELLDGGADDYMTKPFSPAELRARARAQMRRARMAALPEGDEPLTVGDMVIDTARRVIRRGGEYIHLTP